MNSGHQLTSRPQISGDGQKYLNSQIISQRYQYLGGQSSFLSRQRGQNQFIKPNPNVGKIVVNKTMDNNIYQLKKQIDKMRASIISSKLRNIGTVTRNSRFKRFDEQKRSSSFSDYDNEPLYNKFKLTQFADVKKEHVMKDIDLKLVNGHAFIQPTQDYGDEEDDLRGYEYDSTYKVQHNQALYTYISTKNVKKEANQRARKNFRKYVHVVLFTIQLRKYNQRMRKYRKDRFQKIIKPSFIQKLIELKQYFITSVAKVFMKQIISHPKLLKHISQKENQQLIKTQKIVLIKDCVSLLLNCLEKSIQDMTARDFLSETIYYICKHGSFSCFQPIYTQEELNLISISEVFGYIRADRNMEITNIINFVFIKMFLYNVILQPEKIGLQIKNTQNSQNIYRNLRLAGTVIYELLIGVQDDFMEATPKSYIIGNWVNYRKIFQFKPHASMTFLKTGQKQKNELISGLTSHEHIRKKFAIEKMITEQKKIKKMLDRVYWMIKGYHEKIRQKIFYSK